MLYVFVRSLWDLVLHSSCGISARCVCGMPAHLAYGVAGNMSSLWVQRVVRLWTDHHQKRPKCASWKKKKGASFWGAAAELVDTEGCKVVEQIISKDLNVHCEKDGAPFWGAAALAAAVARAWCMCAGTQWKWMVFQSLFVGFSKFKI